jgi:hypothetical protein
MAESKIGIWTIIILHQKIQGSVTAFFLSLHKASPIKGSIYLKYI